MQNQSCNYLITFDIQLKTTLLLISFTYLCIIIITVITIIAIRTCSFPGTTVNLGVLFVISLQTDSINFGWELCFNLLSTLQ